MFGVVSQEPGRRQSYYVPAAIAARSEQAAYALRVLTNPLTRKLKMDPTLVIAAAVMMGGFAIVWRERAKANATKAAAERAAAGSRSQR